MNTKAKERRAVLDQMLTARAGVAPTERPALAPRHLGPIAEQANLYAEHVATRAKLYDQAKACQLDILVEVHDLAEMDRALAIGADMIGINNRNLKTFEVDLATTETLAEEIPNDTVAISESGIMTGEDVRRVRACGVNAVLVGEALMRAKNVPEKLAELLLKS